MPMTLRQSILISLTTLLSCTSTTSNKEMQTNEGSKYTVGLSFINSYVNYCNQAGSDIDLYQWIEKQTTVSSNFKAEFQRIIIEAEKEDPELGLDFDPILDAQDFPDRFEMESENADYLIVKGENWPAFQLTLKLALEEGRWLVDGSGIINVPIEKRARR